MNYNPFTECTVKKNKDGTEWLVSSNYWEIPMKTEYQAARVCALLDSAYHRGVSDNQDKMKDILGILK
jgi:hypothetical protein